jgi:hypothetical protein
MLGQIENHRSYSITQSSDEYHLKNGRCPNYALTWGVSENRRHWPANHDYFMGNGSEIDDGTKELREILSDRLLNGTSTKHIIFCDLDGVLADFEQGVRNKFKKNIDELKPTLMWGVINKSKTFFETLPWMEKGRELWSRIEQYNPIILTGVPPSSSTAVEQKIRWCQRELGPNVKVITCATKDKPNYCTYGSILIDDRTDNLNAWNKKGGKFILYDEEHLDAIVERIDRHMGVDLPSP